MIHKLVVSFFVLMASVIDIRVRALSHEVPKNCLKSQARCSYLNYEVGGGIETKAATIKMGVGTTVTRESDKHFTVVRGAAKVAAFDAVTVKTLYGDLKLSSGEILIEAKDGIVNFTNLSSENFVYVPRGENKEHKLPVGFSTYFTRVTKSGVSDTGYPKLAEADHLFDLWSQFYSRAQIKEFTNEVKSFMQVWSASASVVGPWYVDAIERAIAAEKAEEERLARLMAEREAQSKQIRAKMMKRLNGEE